MKNISEIADQNSQALLGMFTKCMDEGAIVFPRGQEVRELEDYTITIDPTLPFQAFSARKYNVNYFKEEMAWKLGASRYDDSIKQHAKMWESVQNDDGSFNSNYGQYWFGQPSGFWNVIEELIRDKDSRKAVIPMLSKEHMGPDTRDTVCTFAVAFRIRNDVLNMTVPMRSSDQVFGLGTDLPTFSFLYRLVYAVLKSGYRELQVGTLSVSAISSHIYSRHYNMVEDVIRHGQGAYSVIDMPFCSSEEAMAIVASRGKIDPMKIHSDYPLLRWLHSRV